MKPQGLLGSPSGQEVRAGHREGGRRPGAAQRAQTRDLRVDLQFFCGGDTEAGELPRRGQGPGRSEDGGLPAPIQPTPPPPAICLMTEDRSGPEPPACPVRSRLNSILLITKRPLVGEAGSGVPGGLLPSIQGDSSLDARKFLFNLPVGAQILWGARSLFPEGVQVQASVKEAGAACLGRRPCPCRVQALGVSGGRRAEGPQSPSHWLESFLSKWTLSSLEKPHMLVIKMK